MSDQFTAIADIPGEEWRPCSLKHHFVSSMGRVKTGQRKHRIFGGRFRTDPAKIKKQHSNEKGYLLINADGRMWRVHRLVASAFCGQPDGCDQVNHINGIKHDNRAENLEWVTGSGNIQHAVMRGMMPTQRPVVNLDTGEAFPALSVAAKHVGRCSASVWEAIRRDGGRCAGFRWAYVDEVDPADLGRIIRRWAA